MKLLFTFLIVTISFATTYGQVENDTIINKFEHSVHQNLPVSIWLDIHLEVKSLLIQGNYKNDPRFTYKFKTVKNQNTGVWTKTASAAINYNGHIIALDTNYIKKKINELSELDKKAFTPTTSVYFPNELDVFENDFQDTLNFDTEDGFHIKYYKKHYDIENKCWKSKVPFIKYKINNKQLFDTVYFYNLKREIISKGLFLNNKRDGIWYFKNQKDAVELKFEVSYKNGKREGLFKYYENSILRCKGIIKNEKPVGKWETFHKNGKLANSMTFLETPIISHKTILNEFTTRYGELPSGNTVVFIPGYDYHKGKQFHTISYLDKNSTEVHIDGKFQGIYSNGQHMYDWTFDNGILVNGDKVYNSNGTVLFKWIIKENRKKGVFIMYNNDGSIKLSRKL